MLPWMPAAVLLALLLAVGVAQPELLSAASLGLLAGESSIILLLACGQTVVVLLGAIDVSMAALAALVSVLVALALPVLGPTAVPAALALVALLGAFQGWVQARAQLPSVVVTLAGLGLWSGTALLLAPATLPVDAGAAGLGWLEGSSAGVPHAFAFAAGALGVLAAALRWLPFGRRLRALGFNPTAALLSGVRAGRVRVAAFALSGLFAGLAGLAMVARTSSGSPTIADSLLLPSIAAVLVGGTAITGGRGGLARTLVGALTVTVLRLGTAAAGLSPAYEPIVYGALVVVAAALVAEHAPSSGVK